MDPQWIAVILLWGGMIGALTVSLIREARKSPEQKAKEAEQARESWKKYREESRKEREKQKEQREEERRNAPAKGCLQKTLELWLMCFVTFAVIVACIFFLLIFCD